MLKFDVADNRFNFRSVAVIIHQQHVLVHKALSDDFWSLPGGRVEFFEHSDDTLTREIEEELGLQSNVLRHLWYVESFFQYADKNYHEIGNYFLVELTTPEVLPKGQHFKGIEERDNLIFQWLPLAQLAETNIKPAFLKTGLLNLPTSVEFIKSK